MTKLIIGNKYKLSDLPENALFRRPHVNGGEFLEVKDSNNRDYQDHYQNPGWDVIYEGMLPPTELEKVLIEKDNKIKELTAQLEQEHNRGKLQERLNTVSLAKDWFDMKDQTSEQRIILSKFSHAIERGEHDK